MGGRTKKQPAGKVAVTLTCPEEDCTVALNGSTKGKGKKGKALKLKPKTATHVAGQATKIKLKYAKGKKAVKKLKALSSSQKLKTSVVATATDAAGNAATQKLATKVNSKPKR